MELISQVLSPDQLYVMTHVLIPQRTHLQIQMLILITG